MRKRKPVERSTGRKNVRRVTKVVENPDQSTPPTQGRRFNVNFKTEAQKLAWLAYQQHDVLFMTGTAGTGKTFLATAFALSEVLNGTKEKIVITRPIVEAGESLGFLPGEFEEKVHPYMMPIYDCLDKLTGKKNVWRDRAQQALEVAPLAYMRGRTFDDAVCIFDEAQNATTQQLKLFLSRFGETSKVIITGDPLQSDIGRSSGLVEVMRKLKGIDNIGFIEFKENSIVRHRLVGDIIKAIGDC